MPLFQKVSTPWRSERRRMWMQPHLPTYFSLLLLLLLDRRRHEAPSCLRPCDFGGFGTNTFLPNMSFFSKRAQFIITFSMVSRTTHPRDSQPSDAHIIFQLYLASNEMLKISDIAFLRLMCFTLNICSDASHHLRVTFEIIEPLPFKRTYIYCIYIRENTAF